MEAYYAKSYIFKSEASFLFPCISLLGCVNYSSFSWWQSCPCSLAPTTLAGNNVKHLMVHLYRRSVLRHAKKGGRDETIKTTEKNKKHVTGGLAAKSIVIIFSTFKAFSPLQDYQAQSSCFSYCPLAVVLQS